MRHFLFVDTETTGLDSRRDKLVELSYALNDGAIRTLYFGVTKVPPYIETLIKFTERGIAGRKSTQTEISDYLSCANDTTLVAANPTFDSGFMHENGLFVSHYRMIDLSAYAMGVLGLQEMPGQADVVRLLRERGFEVPEPDHTSYNDVAALQACFYHLNNIATFNNAGEQFRAGDL